MAIFSSQLVVLFCRYILSLHFLTTPTHLTSSNHHTLSIHPLNPTTLITHPLHFTLSPSLYPSPHPLPHHTSPPPSTPPPLPPPPLGRHGEDKRSMCWWSTLCFTPEPPTFPRTFRCTTSQYNDTHSHYNTPNHYNTPSQSIHYPIIITIPYRQLLPCPTTLIQCSNPLS